MNKGGLKSDYRSHIELREKLGLPNGVSNDQIMLALLERIERLEDRAELMEINENTE